MAQGADAARVLEFLAQLQPAQVGMEACATAHHWAREIQQLGHEVKLIHPKFVTAYRKEQQERLQRRRGHWRGTCASRAPRGQRADLPYSTCCHTFRATGITAYLQNGGTLEHAQ